MGPSLLAPRPDFYNILTNLKLRGVSDETILFWKYNVMLRRDNNDKIIYIRDMTDLLQNEPDMTHEQIELEIYSRFK